VTDELIKMVQYVIFLTSDTHHWHTLPVLEMAWEYIQLSTGRLGRDFHITNINLKAVSLMHWNQLQVSSNSLFNHYHLACLLPPGLAYHHHHLAFSQASESASYYASELEDMSR
jgi:hypothetical protein